MSELAYRWMEPEEVSKISDIDRAERIRSGYRQAAGKLQQLAVNWDSPDWDREGDGEHSVAHQIGFCEQHLAHNGRMYGAFDGERLAGVGLVTPEIRPAMAQLSWLHVSSGYRRRGIGQRIGEALIDEARKEGANRIYVSATPSGSAVGFYLSMGFMPTDKPLPELFELEPEDIHMIMEL